MTTQVMASTLTEICPVCKSDNTTKAGDPEIIICACGAMLKKQENAPRHLVGFRINPEDR